MEVNYFTILYWFCHTSTWICHRYTRVPHPELPSLLPPRTIPLGRKIFKEMRIPDHLACPLRNLHAGQKSNSQNRTWNNGLLQNLERSTSRLYNYHAAYLTYMQYISCEMSGWVKHKLESRLPGEISVTSGIKVLLFSRSVMSNSLQPHRWQHVRLPCPPPSPRACSNSRPLSQWCHPIISSSVISFSSCLQSLPASGYFLMSQLFASGGQSM